jgi:hypothetical protein
MPGCVTHLGNGELEEEPFHLGRPVLERKLAEADLLRLDLEEDAAAVRGVLAGVAPRHPVHTSSAASPFALRDYPAADVRGPVRVLVIDDRDGDARLALDVARLPIAAA